MKVENFIKKYYPEAKKVENETGISAIAILAQAALESGWGVKAIGNNLFGVKWRIGDKLSQRVVTTEFSPNENAYKTPISKRWDVTRGLWEFKVVQIFADYETPGEAFLAHAKLLMGKRYAPAWEFRGDAKRFLIEVWKCGYATDPDYGRKISNMVDSIIKRM